MSSTTVELPSPPGPRLAPSPASACPTPCLPAPPSFEDALADDGLLSPALLADAAFRIGGSLRPTPLVRSERLGAWLKLENLQTTGAYKVRGALNALAAQCSRGDRRAAYAASAGNHGLGVAWAARHLGLAATIVVPDDAPAVKVQGCRALGARVVRGGASFESCATRARAMAEQDGGRFVHAFDDPEVIAGQSTVAAELLALRPDVVVVPIGGGGLIAGMGSVLRRAAVRVVGVQVTGADSLRRALAGHAPRAGAPAATLADGLRVAAPGRLPLRIASAFLDEIVVVDEAEVAAAMVTLALDERVVAEGAGAVAVAALPHLTGPSRAADRRVAVVSGGNLDPAVLARLLDAAAGH